MFCPNCGTQPQVTSQKYCKVCGTNLETVSQVLHGTPLQLPPGAPPLQFLPNHNTSPTSVPMPVLASLPLMEYEAKRLRLNRIAWAMTLGGIPIALMILVISEVLRTISWQLGRTLEELALFGPVMMLTGIFFLAYLRLAFKKQDMPQVIVVQQSATAPIATQEIQHRAAAGAQAQLPPPSVSSFYGQPSVTEHTTEHLQAPFRMSSKDTH